MARRGLATPEGRKYQREHLTLLQNSSDAVLALDSVELSSNKVASTTSKTKMKERLVYDMLLPREVVSLLCMEIVLLIVILNC